MLKLTPEYISRALELPGFDGIGAQKQMAPKPRMGKRPAHQPGKAQVAAVLLMLYEQHGKTFVLFIKRQDFLHHHPGQISFPGGRQKDHEPLVTTALRETREEISIAPESVAVLGRLAPLYILQSDFYVHPFVAWHPGTPRCQADTREVACILECDLQWFLSSASRGREVRATGSTSHMVPYFLIDGHKIWGATAMILSELLERLQAAAGVSA